MAPDLPGILHVETERGWRGGQQQAAYLHAGLVARGLRSVMACRPGSAMARRMADAGLPCVTVPMRGELDVLAGWRLARLAQRHGAGILHLHSAHAVTLGLWASLFRPRLALVAVRRVEFPLGNHPLSRLKNRSRRLTRYVAISHAISDVMIRGGVAPERITVIHSGVDPHRFDGRPAADEARRELAIPADHHLVGTVAALTPDKDYPTLLRAAAAVITERPDVTFCALGEGAERQMLEAMAAQLGLGDRFRFLGFRKDVGAVLGALDVFVLTSSLEGLGTSVLDALAVGLPVVASRTGGIPEMIDDGRTGLLVTPGDAGGFAQRIIALLDDPEHRRRLGAAAGEVVERFSIENTVARNIALYRELAGAPAPVPEDV
jgi:glycosyltransferase involved in cell wall biosynthesis